MISKLYLHVGHGKTGSSYIQSCLAKSKQLLDENKICYPINEQERLRASLGGISWGNGAIFLEDNYSEFIDEFIKPHHETLLFSNESFIYNILRNTKDIQRKIPETIERLGIKEINILIFIRNPLELASSIYQQAVKRLGWGLDMDAYIHHFTLPYIRILEFSQFIKQWNNVSVKMLNYSYCKHSIINEMENWLQLDKINLYHPEKSIVNRSLTKGEIELMRSINKVLGPSGPLLADALCEKLPYIPSDTLTLSTEAKKIFLEKIEPTVTEINYMVDPMHRLSLRDPKVNVHEDQFIFTKDQISLIGESFASAITNHREEINQLCENQQQILNSLTFRISRKLNNFPIIKKLIKALYVTWVIGKQYLKSLSNKISVIKILKNN